MNDWLFTSPTRSATVLNSMNQPVTPSSLHKASSSLLLTTFGRKKLSVHQLFLD